MRPHRSLALGTLLTVFLTAAGSAAMAAPAERTLTGTVRIVVADDGPAPASPARISGGPTAARGLLEVEGRLVPLPPETLGGLRSGDRVSATVVGSAERASVRAVTRRVTTAATSTVLGRHTLTVLPIYWSQPDDAALDTLATRTAEFWAEQSGSALTVTATARAWVRVADPRSCDPAVLANAALSAHRVSLPTTRTDHVMVYFPTRDDCAWAGLASVDGGLIWDNGYPILDVTAHEFGHNLGLGHANRTTCTTTGGARVTWSTTCSMAEYEDYADVMGLAMYAETGNLTTALADTLGLVRTVTAVPGVSTTVDLAPLAEVAAVRAVKIKVASGWLYVDYRPAVGRDVRMPQWAGVQLHLRSDAPYPTSEILDGQPTGASAFTAAALPVGGSWTVPGQDVVVQVLSAGGTGARVTVGPSGAAPQIPTPGLITPVPGAITGAGVPVGWRLPTSAATVTVLVDGRAVATTRSPGLTGTLTVTGLAAGPHQLTARATDAAGRAGPVSGAVSVTTDRTPPTVPTGLALSGAGVLSWRASADSPAGVAGYLVRLDTGTPTRLAAVTSTAVRIPVGRHRWSVAAVDAVGNVSGYASLSVSRTSAGSRPVVTGSSPSSARTSPPQVLRRPVGQS